MSPDLSTAVWSLPGPRKFIQKIGQDLRRGVSQIIFSPTSSQVASFKESLLECLEKDCFLRSETIDLSSSTQLEPFDLLQATFPGLSGSQYLEKSVEAPDLPDVIFLENLAHGSTGYIQDWINAIDRWAEACRSSGSMHSLVLLLKMVDPAKLKLPSKDVRLNYRVLAGTPSSLEVRLLCRMATDEIDAENQWREFMLASVAGNDFSLVDLLWDEVFNPVESIIKALKIHGKNNGWQKSNDFFPRNWRPKPPGFDLSLSPNEKSFGYLGSGLTIYTSEYGEEIHPCLLALNNMEQEIVHRIWRAQASLLLPAVDDVRRRICNYFTNKYGEDWAIIDKKLFASPLELGELKTFFDYSLSDASWEKRQWGSGVYQTWNIRNDLAHYTPVSYIVYEKFWRLTSSVHSQLSQN